MLSLLFPKTKKQKHRAKVLLIALTIFLVGCVITIYSLKNFIVYYYTPSEIVGKIVKGKRYRIGGLVCKDSVRAIDDHITFILSESYDDYDVLDASNSISVNYKGTLPSLFKEGSGAIAEGIFGKDKILYAENLLAKHDETYKPPDFESK